MVNVQPPCFFTIYPVIILTLRFIIWLHFESDVIEKDVHLFQIKNLNSIEVLYTNHAKLITRIRFLGLAIGRP